MTQDSESVVVPRVPTEAMLDAGAKIAFSPDEPIAEIWSAMLAAAPSIREEARNEVKRLISEHVSACLTMSEGGVIPTPLHPGPTADAIIAALVPSTDEGKRP